MKQFNDHISERLQDIDALELRGPNKPRTRQELIERLSNARAMIGNPVQPLGRGHFSVAVRGQQGPFVLKYSRPDHNDVDGWYHWGVHCYNKWRQGPATSYPNVQLIHDFEDDHGYYAIMQRYEFPDGMIGRLDQLMNIRAIRQGIDSYGKQQFKRYYQTKRILNPWGDVMNVNSIEVLRMLDNDLIMAYKYHEYEAPMAHILRDTWQQTGQTHDFEDAMDDILNICMKYDFEPDIHQGNIGFNGARPVMADPIAFSGNHSR